MSATARDTDETTTGILEELLRVARRNEQDADPSNDDRFSVGDVVSAFGERAFGPFLIVLPLIELTPAGIVPGVPSFLAFMIALVATQLVMGRECLWLPGFVRARSVKSHRVTDGESKLRRVTGWIDEHTGERWASLVGKVGTRVAATLIVTLCLTVPTLEFVPFASSAPMVAILAFGVALLAKDGRLMALAFTLSAAALGLVGYVVFGALLG